MQGHGPPTQTATMSCALYSLSKQVNKSFVVLCLVASAQISNGQSKWEAKYDGFVVTIDNKKVVGFTRSLGSDKERGTKIQLLKEPGGTQQIYFAADLLGYAIGKDTFRVFHNLQPFTDNEENIPHAEAKIVENGRLVLYDIATVSGYYTITSPGVGGTMQSTPIIDVDHTKLIRARNGELVGIDRENFVVEMKGLIKDAPDIVERIESRKLKFKDLKKIVREYNGRFDN